MAFWDLFGSDDQKSTQHSGLYNKVKEFLPEATESELVLVACVSGLFARVIYIDFEVHKNEVVKMKSVLGHWTKLDAEKIKAIVELSIDEIKDLAGLENHLYAHPLVDIIERDQRYSLLESLFAIAASDGHVDEAESEEIRIIAKGLGLEHKHFISARATVLDYIGALKKS